MNQSIRRIPILVFLAALAAAILATSASAIPAPEQPEKDHFASKDDSASKDPNTVPGRYIVVFKDSVDHPGSLAETQIEQRDGDLGFIYRSALKGYSVKGLSKGDVRALRASPKVDYVVPDRKVEAFAQKVPTGVSRVFATENKALDIDETDDVRVNADVAVIDTGIDYTHPDLNVVARTNCVPADEESGESKCVDNSGIDKVDGHGTHVAGTIGALDNGFGVVGAAPGVRLWAVRVLNNEGWGYESWIIAGINWVTAHAGEIEVANMSLGGEGKSPPEEEAIAASLNAGVVYAVAAGNEAVNAANHSPANDPDVITVSALADQDGKPGGLGSSCNGPDDTLAEFSNWGSGVDIAAPGACIYSTLPDGGYGSKSGTSMATPHVAGAAAALASKSNPNSKADVEAIRQALLDEASLAWEDTSEDSTAEPLLYMGEKALTATEIATAGYSSINSESTTLHGTVKPRGLETEYQFEYGTTTEYGQKAPASPKKLAAGTKYASVSEALGGLKVEQPYHYRLVAKNSSGTFYGQDRTFTPSAGGFEVPTSAPESEYEWQSDISCPVQNSCTSVGYYYNNENYVGAYRLSSGKWSFQTISTPNGSGYDGYPQLDGVSCATVNVCTAVGKIQLEGGIVVPLVARYSGGTWSLQSISPPFVGSTYARLRSVSCASDVECIAVGYYKDAKGAWVNYSAQWKNGVWSTLSTPTPEGSDDSELRDVSCVSDKFCKAVGTDYDANEPILSEWDGSKWIVQGAAYGSQKRASVSCLSTSFCMTLGGGLRSEIWDGSKWTLSHYLAYPGTSYINFSGVSCTSESFCVAIGEIARGPRWSGLIEIWNGEGWMVLAAPRKSEAYEDIENISCVPGAVASFGCKAVGFTVEAEYSSLFESVRYPKQLKIVEQAGAATSPTEATLSGTVNPEGLKTTYQFEYGKTVGYGKVAPASPQSIGSGTSDVKFSQKVSGLEPFVSYHYRLKATNELGTSFGEDKTFKTPRDLKPPTYSSSFGTSGSGSGQFNAPSDIATDSGGNAWVLDRGNDRVQQFSSKGEFISKFGSNGTGKGQFVDPKAIAVDPEGDLWVAEWESFRVQQFSAKGEYLSEFAPPAGTVGMDFGPAGNLWILNAERKVQQYSQAGKLLTEFKPGLLEPKDIAIGSDNSVWVLDTGNRRIQKFSAKGEALHKFGSNGSGDGQFSAPLGLEIDAEGNLWVADTNNHRVQEIYAEGEYVAKFGSSGSGEGQFKSPNAVAADTSGNLWVLDAGNNRVQKWVEPALLPVETRAATSVNRTEATLNGSINPQGVATSYQIEYGLTNSYGNKVPAAPKSIGSGSSHVKVSEALTGLKTGTKYHYRVVATSEKGTTYGEDRFLTTQAGAGVGAQWRIGGKTFAELGIKEETLTASGSYKIAFPSFGETLACSETGSGTLTSSGPTVINMTLKCEVPGSETCVFEPIKMDVNGSFSSIYENLALIKSKWCGVLSPEQYLVNGTGSFHFGNEATKMNVGAYHDTTFGANPVNISGSTYWQLTGKYAGSTVGVW